MRNEQGYPGSKPDERGLGQEWCWQARNGAGMKAAVIVRWGPWWNEDGEKKISGWVEPSAQNAPRSDPPQVTSEVLIMVGHKGEKSVICSTTGNT